MRKIILAAIAAFTLLSSPANAQKYPPRLPDIETVSLVSPPSLYGKRLADAGTNLPGG